MTRTGLVARLFSHSPEPEIVVSRLLICKKYDFSDQDLVRVTSRRGSIVMKIRASDDMRPGDAFVAMHWGGRFTGGVGTNALTVPAIDPYSKQPELKHAAVRIEPFAARWRGAFSAPATAELQRAAGAWLARFDYATLTLVEGPEILLRLELATAGDPAAEACRRSRSSSASRPSPALPPSSAPSAPASRSANRRSAPRSPPARTSPGCRRT